MIVKTAELLEEAREIFQDTGITIDFQGDRHLGAVIGNQDFKEKYVRKKINNWIKDVEQLSTIAEDEPQLALNAYTKALCMRWCFVQRTISNVGHLFQPLEDVLREKFIPAIVGRNVSDQERRFLALPVRFGGIGILNPAETAELEFTTSVKITTINLKSLITKREIFKT